MPQVLVWCHHKAGFMDRGLGGHDLTLSIDRNCNHIMKHFNYPGQCSTWLPSMACVPHGCQTWASVPHGCQTWPVFHMVAKHGLV